MKRTTKIAIVLVVLGTILTGIGWLNHGNKGVVWSSQARRFEVIHHSTTTYQPAAYDKIVIDAHAPVTIESGETSRVRISHVGDAQGQLRAKVDHGTLTISGSNATEHLSNTIFGFSDDDYRQGVHITVPRDQQLAAVTLKRGWSVLLQSLRTKQLDAHISDDLSLYDVTVDRNVNVQSSNGDVWVNNLRARQLKLQAENGDVGMNNSRLTSRHNQVNAANGDLRVTKNTLGGGRLQTDNGDIHLLNNRLDRVLTAKTADGDITAHIAKSAGVKTMVKDSDMGDIKVFGKVHNSGYQRHPKAAAQYRLTSTDGDVTVSAE
ncbi:DUF4097 family beta strand repeat-containing protein [Levilactobacillus angrenensis]|uniref:DUF4097 family beta strand repeat-containing protein n=1 Tax=Levilactobacillus angrenensis TaxID=2486020 RepID=A0ABW1U627_9LACO|nr:DUF4097 family beta strand repeat-containing protein [Levilactobacillus angrenensis]